MKTLFFCVFSVLLLQVAVVNALKCYVCSSTKDWAGCDDNKKEFICPSSMTKCAKFESHTTIGQTKTNQYSKGCSLASLCEIKALGVCNVTSSGVSINCKINCCDDDLCNVGAVPLVSGIILLTCSVLSIFKIF